VRVEQREKVKATKVMKWSDSALWNRFKPLGMAHAYATARPSQRTRWTGHNFGSLSRYLLDP
jgi:hypothetical protein